MIDHKKKYQALYEKLSKDDINSIEHYILQHIDNGKYKNIQGKNVDAKLKRLYQLDEHLNNIPLKIWDRLAGFTMSYTTGELYNIGTNLSFPLGLSLAERVCLLKHTIRQYIVNYL